MVVKIKQSLCKPLLIIAGLFIGIAIAEVVAGRYIKRTKLDEKIEYMESTLKHHHSAVRFDKHLGWKLKPYVKDRVITSDFDVVYSINSKGIRDKEIPFQKPAREFRIIALGESTVFGWGINYGQRFTDIMEQSLKHVEVINMGVGGFGIDQSLLQLKKGGFRYNPDLVVLFVSDYFLERCKDFITSWDAFKPRFVLNEDETKLILQDVDFVKDTLGSQKINYEFKVYLENASKWVKGTILRKSKLLSLLKYSVFYKKVKMSLEERDKEWWNGVFKKEQFIVQRRSEEYKKKYFQKLIFLLLKQYKELCDGHKVQFLVVEYSKKELDDSIVNFCHTLDIPYLDLFTILDRVSNFNSLYFEIDTHLNEFSHRVIGEYVAEYLREKYYLQKNRDFTYHYFGRF